MKKILIVDDNEDFRKIMDGILTDEGFYTIEATDGAAAIGSVLIHDPDIVMLDCQMPQVDGFEALKHLKRLRPKLPVVVVTGMPDPDVASRAISSGADRVILKPPDFEELVAVIKEVADGV